MNLTSSDRIKSRVGYLASAAAATLISLALMTSASGRENDSSVIVGGVTAQARAAGSSNAEHYYFYIVRSESERAAILRGNEELAELAQRPEIHVLIAGSPATEEFLYHGVEALMQAGMDFTVMNWTSAEATSHHAADIQD